MRILCFDLIIYTKCRNCQCFVRHCVGLKTSQVDIRILLAISSRRFLRILLASCGSWPCWLHDKLSKVSGELAVHAKQVGLVDIYSLREDIMWGLIVVNFSMFRSEFKSVQICKCSSNLRSSPRCPRSPSLLVKVPNGSKWLKWSCRGVTKAVEAQNCRGAMETEFSTLRGPKFAISYSHCTLESSKVWKRVAVAALLQQTIIYNKTKEKRRINVTSRFLAPMRHDFAKCVSISVSAQRVAWNRPVWWQ